MIGLFTDGVVFPVDEKKDRWGDRTQKAVRRHDAYREAAELLIDAKYSVSEAAEGLFVRAKKLEASPDNMGLILVKFDRDGTHLTASTTDGPRKVAKTD